MYGVAVGIRLNGHEINFLYEVLKQKQNFRKAKIVTGKTPFFMISPSCTSRFICLSIGFWQGSFVEKCFVFNSSTLS